jgi:tRNA(adenine34) deaminase
MAFWTYMLRCSDGSYYTGHTDDLDARIGQHHAGVITGCYTHDRRPLTLVYAQPFETREEALAAERQVKGWHREKKEALIAGDFARLQMLARTAQAGGATSGLAGRKAASGIEARPSTGSARTESSGVLSEQESRHGLREPESRGGPKDPFRLPPVPVRGEPVEPSCQAASGFEAQASTGSARTESISSPNHPIDRPPAPVRGEPVEPSCQAASGFEAQASTGSARTESIIGPNQPLHRPPVPVRGEPVEQSCEAASGFEAHASTGSARTDSMIGPNQPLHRPPAPVRGEPVEPFCEAASGFEAHASTGSARTDSMIGPNQPLHRPSAPVRGEPVEPPREATTACDDQARVTPLPADIDIHYMQHALRLAERAEREYNEIPVGALLVDADGRVVGEGWNRNIAEHDPSAHAEIVALRAAGRALGNHRLVGSTLYVTLEPCAMCAMAIVHARVARLVYGASDPKTGACGGVFDLIADPRHNHRVDVLGGVLGEEAGQRLREYFRRKRGRPAGPG